MCRDATKINRYVTLDETRVIYVRTKVAHGGKIIYLYISECVIRANGR